MNFLKKIFRTEDRKQEIREDITIKFSDLKQKIKSSVIKINEIEDDYAEPLIESLFNTKLSLKELSNAELRGDSAIHLKADNERKSLVNALLSQMVFKKPKDLITLNKFINDVKSLINNYDTLINNSGMISTVFQEQADKLSNNINQLRESLNEVIDGISERNEQLIMFKELIREVKNLNEAISKLRKIKEEEMELRRTISNYERDKAFLSTEIARIKALDTYIEQSRAENSLKNINNQKMELESNASKIINKFSRLMRKEFNNDEFTTQLLTNPLDYICKNEGLFNKRMRELIRKVKNTNDKDKDYYLKALSNDKINDYINDYKKLLKLEKTFNNKDFSLLRKYKAFERRLININQSINTEIKKLDSFKTRIRNAEEELEAIKAKVEAQASKCYGDNVKVIIS